MTASNAAWSWDSASSASTSSTAPSSSSSSPHTLSSAHFTSTSSNSSSSNSDDCPATTTTSSSSASNSSSTYKSKSDAFFSSYASMAPIKPPSSIFSRRASDSCLPPPCAVPVKVATAKEVAIQSAQATASSSARPCLASSSTLSTSSTRERFASLPDIREHQSYTSTTTQGLGIRSPSPPLLASTSASTSAASSSLQSSRSSSLNTSGSSSPSTHTHRNRQSSIEDIEARLQAAISNLSESTSTVNEDEDDEGDMYNDIPSSSSSSCTSASSSRTASIANTHQSIEQQQQQQLSVFGEEEDEDDENGGTTIRIRLASAGDLMSRNGRNYDQDGSDYENSFQPCYPLTRLEIDNKPLHRIRRKVSIRKAISDSCRIYSSSGADLQGRSRIREEREKEERRKVSFCDCVQVVDVFAAIDYPARRGPPPIERLTMRDVLELRQIKLELAAYMGEELPEPEHVETIEKEEEQEDIKDFIEISENSLPTTPALEGSPILEQLGEITPLASSCRKNQVQEDVEISSPYRQVSKYSSSSSALGPGMQIDLHSLIEAPSNIRLPSLDQDEEMASSSLATSSLPSTTSFSYSSPPSSCQESEINSSSLSCSPTTSDSEFGSGSGTLSSCGEYDSNIRRGSCSTGEDNNSSEFDDDDEDEETTEDDDEMGDEDDNNNQFINNGGNTRTPTRVSLLRPGQFNSIPSPKSRNTPSSNISKKDENGKIEIGCVQIALPALTANDGYSMNNTFDISPSRQQDAWNPTTF